MAKNINILIGLTGGIACGKSSVSKIIEDEFDAVIIDADKISWKLCEPGGATWLDVVKHFGIYYLNEDQTINRRKFGNFIFNDLEAKALLESFSHPNIIDCINHSIAQYAMFDHDFIIVDAPLLIEVGLHEDMDAVVVVDIPKELQIQRYAKRNDFSEEVAKARINTQISREERLKYANYVIDNSGDLETLKNNVLKTFNLNF